ncbi:SAF domain-containing protein [Pseudoduganella lurida]|uniref:SAF domain-containing protein n=1 Tax=Pseudoduganella lurida TaxID=1036180 RepID=A0A562RL21_9BURK|nr:UxaA family hydrolase [Pseudoduganella lurida]TWI69739.1 SAF domain-containing protein [Pseudoduganella lurida]
MPTDEAPAAPRLLLMAPEDNCLIARLPLAAGETLAIDGADVTLPEAVPLGYKVARVPLSTGTKVLRYGAIIGTVTAPVAQGAVLHTHNLVSDYIPTYTLAGDGHAFIGTRHP